MVSALSDGLSLLKDREPMIDIHRRFETEIPGLQRYVRTLTHDVTAADDLVRDCLAQGLGRLHFWREG